MRPNIAVDELVALEGTRVQYHSKDDIERMYRLAELSVIDTVYGSLGTVVFVLLYLEAAAVILLLGAQVIAEFERSAGAGIAWYEDPDEVERERSSLA